MKGSPSCGVLYRLVLWHDDAYAGTQSVFRRYGFRWGVVAALEPTLDKTSICGFGKGMEKNPRIL